MKNNEIFMGLAIEQAVLARQGGDYPIGAVLVLGGEVLSAQGNRNIRDADPGAHAESLCIREVTHKLQNRNLPKGCVLYSTHEPCPMCASQAVWANLTGLVFGALLEDIVDFRTHYKPPNGFRWQTIDIKCGELFARSETGKEIKIVEAFMRDECLKLFHI